MIALMLVSAGVARFDGVADAATPGEVKITARWANTNEIAPIRKRPSAASSRIGKLRRLTEDGFPEVYRVYKSIEGVGGDWAYIGIPARPNGQKGWVETDALSAIRESHQLLKISRSKHLARLFVYTGPISRKKVWASRIGNGAPGTETPGGNFWIRERIKNLRGGSLYGPLAFGTSAYSKLSDWPGGGVIGIHGTDQPWLIPGYISHGCVRVPNPKIKQLGRKLKVGTPIEIR